MRGSLMTTVLPDVYKRQVRGGFPNVVKARPYIFSRAVGIVFLSGEFHIRTVGPAGGVQVIGTDLVEVESLALVPVHGEEVFSAGADAGGGFRTIERLVGARCV